MSEGKIEYSFKCNGLELRAIEIPLGLDLVPYVAIETIDDDVLRATFATKNIYSEKEARGITDHLIEKLTERLSFFLNTAVTKPVFTSSSLLYKLDEAKKGKHGFKVISAIELDGIIRVIVKPGEKKREDIISFLKNPPVANELLLSEFAYSLTQ